MLYIYIYILNRCIHRAGEFLPEVMCFCWVCFKNPTKTHLLCIQVTKYCQKETCKVINSIFYRRGLIVCICIYAHMHVYCIKRNKMITL